MKYAYLFLSGFLVSVTFAGVTKITSKNQLSGPAVVKIYAKWCGACKGIAGAYKKLSDNDSVNFYEVDYDEAPSFASIEALPTFIFFDASGNQVGDPIVGAEIGQVKQKIRNLVPTSRVAQVETAPLPQSQEAEIKMVEVQKEKMPEMKQIQVEKAGKQEGIFGMVGSFFSFLTDSLTKIICGIVAFVKGVFKR